MDVGKVTTIELEIDLWHCFVHPVKCQPQCHASSKNDLVMSYPVAFLTSVDPL